MRKEDAKLPRYHLVWHCGQSQQGTAPTHTDYSGPYYDGIYVNQLKKDDIVSFEATAGRFGIVRLRLKVTYPTQGGVEIVSIVKVGGLLVEIPKIDLGLNQGIRGSGHFVIRGWVEGVVMLNWIGCGANVSFTDSVMFKEVKNITLNGSLIIFPKTNTIC